MHSFLFFQGASQATNNSYQASLTRICIQLTPVMELTWILGLLANWNQTAFLHGPSTFLNSMQGNVDTCSVMETVKINWKKTSADGFSRQPTFLREKFNRIVKMFL